MSSKIFFLVMTVSSIVPVVVFGCSCATPTDKGQFCMSSFVVNGTVLRKLPQAVPNGQWVEYEVKINNVFRGSDMLKVDQTVPMATTSTEGIYQGMCGVKPANSAYLFSGFTYQGKPTLDLCHWHKTWETVPADLRNNLAEKRFVCP